jgi:hypothetical protein
MGPQSTLVSEDLNTRRTQHEVLRFRCACFDADSNTSMEHDYLLRYRWHPLINRACNLPYPTNTILEVPCHTVYFPRRFVSIGKMYSVEQPGNVGLIALANWRLLPTSLESLVTCVQSIYLYHECINQQFYSPGSEGMPLLTAKIGALGCAYGFSTLVASPDST